MRDVDIFLVIDFLSSGMRGDLHTLKKVCKYASTVMLIGEIVFAALTIAMVVLGVVAQFSDPGKDFLLDLIGSDGSDGLRTFASFMVVLFIFILGFITVRMIHDTMVSIMTEYSPFIPENARRTKVVSISFLVASFLFLLFGILAGKAIIELLFLFFGSVLVSVVMYCITIIVRYGTLLQKESDETL